MRVYQRGKRWWVERSYNPKRYRRSAGRTKREALLKLGEIVRRIEEEKTLGIPATAPRSFSEYSKDYLSHSKSEKAESTSYRERSRMKYLVDAFGEKKLSEITALDIERYKQVRRASVKPASVNRELSLLRHMLRKAVDWGYLRENPARTVKQFKEPPGRVRYLSPEERNRLLEECHGMLKHIVLIALETGMRKGELESLTWDNVDFTRRSIRLARTKNNEARTIPISDTLLLVLWELYRNRRGKYVCTKSDGTPYGNCRKGFESALKRAGIENFRFHDLRHTFASYLVMSGVDIRTVQVLMGHKDIKMTMRYAHLSQSHLLDAVNSVGTKLTQNNASALDDLVSCVSTKAPVAQKDRASDF